MPDIITELQRQSELYSVADNTGEIKTPAPDSDRYILSSTIQAKKVADATYDKIAADSLNPEEMKYRIDLARAFSDIYQMPVESAFGSLDALVEDYFTKKPDMKTAPRAVLDSFRAGAMFLEVSTKTFRQFMTDAIDTRGGKFDQAQSDKLWAEIYEEYDKMAEIKLDIIPRSWITSALKMAAGSAPYTMVAMATSGVGALAGATAGSMGASLATSAMLRSWVATTASAMTIYPVLAGSLYNDMVASGVDKQKARGFALLGGAVSWAIEQFIGTEAAIKSAFTQGSASKLTQAVMKRIYGSNDIASIGAKFLIREVMTMGEEMVQEGGEALSDALFTAMAQAYTADEGGEIIDPVTAGKMFKSVAESVAGAMITSPLFGLIPNIHVLRLEQKQVKAAYNQAKAYSTAEAFKKDAKEAGVFSELGEFNEEAQDQALSELFNKAKTDEDNEASKVQEARAAAREAVKTGTLEGQQEPVRMESGRLRERVESAPATIEGKQAERVTFGHAKESTAYGSIEVEVGDDFVSIIGGRVKEGYESSAASMIEQLADRYPTKEITIDTSLKSSVDDVIIGTAMAVMDRQGGRIQSLPASLVKNKALAQAVIEKRNQFLAAGVKASELGHAFTLALAALGEEGLRNLTIKGSSDLGGSEGQAQLVETANAVKAVITLLNKEGRGAVAVTALHELFHVFRLFKKGSPELAAIEKEYGIKNGVWEVEHNERLANDGLRFIEAGNISIPQAQRFMKEASVFIKNFWAGASEDPTILINPEVAAVFDKWISSSYTTEAETEIKSQEAAAPARRKRVKKEQAAKPNPPKEGGEFRGAPDAAPMPKVTTSSEDQALSERVNETVKRLKVELGNLKVASQRKKRLAQNVAILENNIRLIENGEWVNHPELVAMVKSDIFNMSASELVQELEGWAQVSWESRPGRTTNILAAINDAPYEEQMRFQEEAAKIFMDKNGEDRLARLLGLKSAGGVFAPGVWQKEIAAGRQEVFIVKDPVNITAEERAAIETYASIIGTLFRQEGMGWGVSRALKDGEVANAAQINIGRPLSGQEAIDLWTAIDGNMKAKGYSEWEGSSAVISTPTGIRVVSFGIGEGDIQVLIDSMTQWGSTIDVDSSVGGVMFDGDLLENNWEEAPDGQGYRERASNAGRGGDYDRAISLYSEAVQRLFERYSDLGYGEAGQVPGTQKVETFNMKDSEVKPRRPGALVVNVRNPTAKKKSEHTLSSTGHITDLGLQDLLDNDETALPKFFKNITMIGEEKIEEHDEDGNVVKQNGKVVRVNTIPITDSVKITNLKDQLGTILEIKEHFKANTRYMYELLKARGKGILERARLWYEGAHRLARHMVWRYDVSIQQSAGMLAVCSPSTDWDKNIAMVYRILDMIKRWRQIEINEEVLSTADTILPKSKGKDGAPDKPQRPIVYTDENKNTIVADREWVKSMFDKGGIPALLAEYQKTGSETRLTEAAIMVRIIDKSMNDSKYALTAPEGYFYDYAKNQDGKFTKFSFGSFLPIRNALAIYADGSIENISNRLGNGHKVRSFYNNIVDPNSIDGEFNTNYTHAVAGQKMMPLGQSSPEVAQNFGGGNYSALGIKGTYPLYSDVHREVAHEKGEIVRGLQSINWVSAKLLFDKKTPESIGKARAIWKEYADGQIDLGSAQSRIVDLFGGIGDPDWLRSDPKGVEGIGVAPYGSRIPGLQHDGNHPGGDVEFAIPLAGMEGWRTVGSENQDSDLEAVKIEAGTGLYHMTKEELKAHKEEDIARLAIESLEYGTVEEYVESELGSDVKLTVKDKQFLGKIFAEAHGMQKGPKYAGPGAFVGDMAREGRVESFIRKVGEVAYGGKDRNLAKRLYSLLQKSPAIKGAVESYRTNGGLSSSERNALVSEIGNNEPLAMLIKATADNDNDLRAEAMARVENEKEIEAQPDEDVRPSGLTIAQKQELLNDIQDPLRSSIEDESVTESFLEARLAVLEKQFGDQGMSYKDFTKKARQESRATSKLIRKKYKEAAALRKMKLELKKMKKYIFKSPSSSIGLRNTQAIRLIQSILEKGQNVKSQEALDAMKASLTSIIFKHDPQFANAVWETVVGISEKPVKDWTYEQVKQLALIVNDLEKSGRAEQRSIQSMKRLTEDNYRTRILAEIMKNRHYQSPVSPDDSRYVKGQREMKRGRLAKFLDLDSTRFDAFVREYLSPKGSKSDNPGKVYDLLFSDAVGHVREKYTQIDKRVKAVQDFFDEHKMAGSMREQVTIKGVGVEGQDLEISRSKLIGYYLMIGDKDNFNNNQRETAIYGNLFSREETDRSLVPAPLEEEGANGADIEEVEERNAEIEERNAALPFQALTDNELTQEYNEKLEKMLAAFDENLKPEERDLATLMMKAVDNDTDWWRFADAVYTITGVEPTREKFYFPIQFVGGLSHDPGNIKQRLKDVGFDDATALDIGNSIDRKRKINPRNRGRIEVDAWRLFFDSIEKQEHLINMGEYGKMMSRLFMDNKRSQTMMEAIRNSVGDDGVSTIRDQIHMYLNPTAKNKHDPGSAMLSFARGSQIVANLAYRISTPFMQILTSGLPTLAVAPGEFAAVCAEMVGSGHPVQWYKAIEERSSILKHRQMSEWITYLLELDEEGMTGIMKGVGEFGMKPLVFADRLMVAVSWEAVRRAKVKEFSRGKDSLTKDEMDNHNKSAMALADEFIIKTQPTSEDMFRSPLYRNMNAWKQVLLQFTQPLNVIWNNVRYDMPQAIREREYGRFMGFLMAYIISGLAVGLTRKLRGQGPDDDDEDRVKVGYWAHASISQYVESIPFLGDIASNLMKSAITGERMKWFGDENLPAVASTVDGISTLVYAMNKGELTESERNKAFKSLFEGVGSMMFVPTRAMTEYFSIFFPGGD